MDQLEKYIKENREVLDALAPSEKIWQEVSKKLEQDALAIYIENNKEQFNHLEVREKLWLNINDELENKNKVTALYTEKPNFKDKKDPKLIPITYLWRLAAAFIVFLIAVVWIQFKLLYQNNESQNTGLANVEDRNATLQDINPELSDAESYYEAIIAIKQDEIMQYNLVELGLNEEFKYDLEHLDSAYIEIKAELLNGVENDYIVKALIDNLQLRMEILNRQLEILNNIKKMNRENESVIQL
ncbi:MAG: hypothetical protein AAGI07_08960 [Bacteroidota bacterium]